MDLLTQPVGLSHYLIVGAVLFVSGIVCMAVKRNTLGILMGIELVRDKKSKTPFDEAGKKVYQKAFRKGLAWIPAGHILRMSPPIVMEDEVLLKGLDMIDQAIGETEQELL